MALITIDYDIEFVDKDNEIDYLYFELQTHVRTIDVGIGDYEFWGCRGNHSVEAIQVDEDVEYIDCIVTEHTENELEIIKKWILENEKTITEDFEKKYSRK